jgi:hypothetical protein
LEHIIERMQLRFESRIDRLETSIATLQSAISAQPRFIISEIMKFSTGSRANPKNPGSFATENGVCTSRDEEKSTMDRPQELRPASDAAAAKQRPMGVFKAVRRSSGQPTLPQTPPSPATATSSIVLLSEKSTPGASNAHLPPLAPVAAAEGPPVGERGGAPAEAARSQRLASGRELLHGGSGRFAAPAADGSSSSDAAEDDEPRARRRRLPALARLRQWAQCDARAARGFLFGVPQVDIIIIRIIE